MLLYYDRYMLGKSRSNLILNFEFKHAKYNASACVKVSDTPLMDLVHMNFIEFNKIMNFLFIQFGI